MPAGQGTTAIVNSPMTMARLRNAPDSRATRRFGRMIRNEDREPAGAQALGGLGEGPDVDRPQPGVDRPVHVRQRQDDVGEDQQGAAADIGVGEGQRWSAEGLDQAEDEDDRRDDERQEGHELDDRPQPRGAEPDPVRGRDDERDAEDDRDQPDDERVGEAADRNRGSPKEFV